MYPGGMHKLVVGEEYRIAIVKHGGIPLLILPVDDIDYGDIKYSMQNDLDDNKRKMLIETLKLCDGILMPGGFKINKFDRFICEYAIENNIPLFGICLGMQIMSNYKKEELWNEKNNTSINHLINEKRVVHDIFLDKSSKLYSIVQHDKFMVNSRHSFHALPNSFFHIAAKSEDDIIEAIENPNLKFCIGVQWHPEDMDDDTSNLLFDTFIKSCIDDLR